MSKRSYTGLWVQFHGEVAPVDVRAAVERTMRDTISLPIEFDSDITVDIEEHSGECSLAFCGRAPGDKNVVHDSDG